LSKAKIEKESSRDQFVEYAKNGKILVNQCTKCNSLNLETVYFCDNCFNDSFTQVAFNGNGKVITYTIQSVVPEDSKMLNLMHGLYSN